jgi:hypothetical protein
METDMRRAGLLIALSLSAAVANAQPAPRPAAASTLVDPAAAVADVRRAIAETYVLPERRPALDAVLAEGLSSGRYGVRDPVVLAERINADLARVGRDRHLGFSYNPEQAALISRPGGGAPDPEAFLRLARGNNHGLTGMRVLPGNIRYLACDGFTWAGAESAAALDLAMRFLAGGDAAIIDLRRNGGGSPLAVQYMISHFLPPDRPLVTFYMNGVASPDRLSTLAELPAGRMVGKPLYVLISGRTGSAAEEFTGHVAGYRIGELVGETTAGAGFRNALVPIGGQFVLSVSVGRAVLASTGRDWEAAGHAPTIQAPVETALDVASVHALRRLAAGSLEARSRLEAIAESIAARNERRTPALPLTAYAGVYGEPRLIVENGRLHARLGRSAPIALIPLGGHNFALDDDPAMRLEAELSNGRVVALVLRGPDGPARARFERSDD